MQRLFISDENNNYDQFHISYTDTFTRHRYYTNSNELFIAPNKEYLLKVESNGQLITW